MFVHNNDSNNITSAVIIILLYYIICHFDFTKFYFTLAAILVD